jgi:glycosyltransferase involved in cell wall biosynthesis
MPRVTVVLCSYNQREYLREAAESVLAQTYDDYELLVIDNGSTDGSQEVLRSFEGDPRVRLHLHETNIAVSKRFNEAVQLARGELITFLYSDDMFLPTKLALQVAELDRLGPAFGVVNARSLRFTSTNGERWDTTVFRETGNVLAPMLRQLGIVNMSAPLARRECFVKYPFYEDIFAEGEASWLKVAMTYKFGFIDEAVCLLRDHDANRGRALRRNAEMTVDALQRLIRHPDFPPECLPDAIASMRRVLRVCAWALVRLDGDAVWARQAFRDAIKLDWREAMNPRTVLGYALSHVPGRARAALNSFGHRITGTKGNRTVIADYGGGDARASGS